LHARAIPQHEWAEFLGRFSRQHDRWLSTIEVIEPGRPLQVQVRDRPLTGITVDGGDGGSRTISVLMGGESPDHAVRVIHDPVEVILKETSEGAHEALEVESRDGSTTRVAFRSVVPAERVDGILLDR
jgi:hypothetical protein